MKNRGRAAYEQSIEYRRKQIAELEATQPDTPNRQYRISKHKSKIALYEHLIEVFSKTK